MYPTVIIIQVLGAYFIISGLFLVFRGKTLALLLHDLYKNKVLTFFIGIFISITGAALIISNRVNDSVTNFIEIISWIILIKGLLYMFFPKALLSIRKHFGKVTYSLAGLAAVAVGVFLLFFLS